MRYFFKYLDLNETAYLRNQSHPRTIGRYEDNSPITSDLGSVIRRYMGMRSVPEDLVGDLKDVSIIGVLKNDNGDWIISREFKPDWVRKFEDLGYLYIPEEFRKEYVAGTNKEPHWMNFFATSNCYAIGETRLLDGRKVSQLSIDELQNLFSEIDIKTFRFFPQGSLGRINDPNYHETFPDEENDFGELCYCINCECMIHVDDVSNGVCAECGADEPESPVVDYSEFERIFKTYDGELEDYNARSAVEILNQNSTCLHELEKIDNYSLLGASKINIDSRRVLYKKLVEHLSSQKAISERSKALEFGKNLEFEEILRLVDYFNSSKYSDINYLLILEQVDRGHFEWMLSLRDVISKYALDMRNM